MGNIDPKEIVPIQKDEDLTSAVMRRSVDDLVEGLTGLAASEKREYALSLGHLFQSLTKGSFLNTLRYEWDKYRKAGKIEDDYLRSEQHRANFQEMLDFLDNDSPDETRFGFLKKIFLSIATEENDNRDGVLPQQIMKIARTLTAGEILILAANSKLVKEGIWRKERDSYSSTDHWLRITGVESKLQYKALVEVHEQTLIEKKLLTPRRYSDNSGMVVGENYRLTDLAMELLKYVEGYEDLTQAE